MNMSFFEIDEMYIKEIDFIRSWLTDTKNKERAALNKKVK